MADRARQMEKDSTKDRRIGRKALAVPNLEQACFYLFVLGGIVGILNAAVKPVPFGEGFEMVSIARNLAANGAFANPFTILKTGPTAVNPPLYPLCLALIIKVFRAPTLVLLIATLGTVLANAASASMFPRLSQILFHNPLPGLVAAVLLLFSTPLLPAWDVNYTVAGLILFCLFTSTTLEKKENLYFASVAGLIAAALFLFNPSSILIFLPWIAYQCMSKRSSFGHTAAYFGVVLAILVTAGLVWSARNYRVLGGFVVRSNLGMNLYSANNDCADYSWEVDMRSGCHQNRYPDFGLYEAQSLRELGEIRYDKQRMQIAQRWIVDHPNRFAGLTFLRIRDFWFPFSKKYLFQDVFIWIGTLLSIPGLVVLLVKQEKASCFILSALLIYPPLYYVMISDARYRYPLLWLSLLPAGYFVDWLVKQPARRYSGNKGSCARVI